MIRTVYFHACSPQFLFVCVSKFHMYVWLRSSFKVCKFGSFAYSIRPPRCPNYVWNSSFSCLESISSGAIASFSHGCLLDVLHRQQNIVVVSSFYKLLVSNIPNCWYTSCLVIFFTHYYWLHIPCKHWVGHQLVMLHVCMYSGILVCHLYVLYVLIMYQKLAYHMLFDCKTFTNSRHNHWSEVEHTVPVAILEELNHCQVTVLLRIAYCAVCSPQRWWSCEWTGNAGFSLITFILGLIDKAQSSFGINICLWKNLNSCGSADIGSFCFHDISWYMY